MQSLCERDGILPFLTCCRPSAPLLEYSASPCLMPPPRLSAPASQPPPLLPPGSRGSLSFGGAGKGMPTKTKPFIGKDPAQEAQDMLMERVTNQKRQGGPCHLPPATPFSHPHPRTSINFRAEDNSPPKVGCQDRTHGVYARDRPHSRDQGFCLFPPASAQALSFPA